MSNGFTPLEVAWTQHQARGRELEDARTAASYYAGQLSRTKDNERTAFLLGWLDTPEAGVLRDDDMVYTTLTAGHPLEVFCSGYWLAGRVEWSDRAGWYLHTGERVCDPIVLLAEGLLARCPRREGGR